MTTKEHSKMDLRELEEGLDMRNLYIGEAEKRLEKTTDVNEHNKIKTELEMLEEQRYELRKIICVKYESELRMVKPAKLTFTQSSLEDSEEVAQLKHLIQLRDERLHKLSMEINQLRHLLATHSLITSLPSLGVDTITDFHIQDISFGSKMVIIHLMRHEEGIERATSILFKDENRNTLLEMVRDYFKRERK